MRRDAQKDPVVFPEALRAKLLINQVDFTTQVHSFDVYVTKTKWIT